MSVGERKVVQARMAAERLEELGDGAIREPDAVLGDHEHAFGHVSVERDADIRVGPSRGETIIV